MYACVVPPNKSKILRHVLNFGKFQYHFASNPPSILPNLLKGGGGRVASPLEPIRRNVSSPPLATIQNGGCAPLILRHMTLL